MSSYLKISASHPVWFKPAFCLFWYLMCWCTIHLSPGHLCLGSNVQGAVCDLRTCSRSSSWSNEEHISCFFLSHGVHAASLHQMRGFAAEKHPGAGGFWHCWTLLTALAFSTEANNCAAKNSRKLNSEDVFSYDFVSYRLHVCMGYSTLAPAELILIILYQIDTEYPLGSLSWRKRHCLCLMRPASLKQPTWLQKQVLWDAAFALFKYLLESWSILVRL